MALFNSPTSFRLARKASNFEAPGMVSMASLGSFADGTYGAMRDDHPNFGHLILLVFEAVLEVVVVSAPGYILARQGMFDVEAQKFLANLNVQLFTPCLIFTKLASQLNADKLAELAIIPCIFIVQTLVSYLCAIVVSKLCGFKERPRNFLTAMSVFGNSNSLPISLVLSLSKTISGLHWDKIPGDNDDEVGARGILYLLIFQQLGQVVRWSWGYNVLLKPADQYPDEDEGRNARLENGDAHEQQGLLEGSDRNSIESVGKTNLGGVKSTYTNEVHPDSDYESGSITPFNGTATGSSSCSSSSSISDANGVSPAPGVMATPANGNVAGKGPGNFAGHNGDQYHDDMTQFPTPAGLARDAEYFPPGPKGWWMRSKLRTKQTWNTASGAVSRVSSRAFGSLPQPIQKVSAKIYNLIARFLLGLWSFMNPPLWAMVIAIVIASVPSLQHLFFDPGTFVNNSVSSAIKQSGGVAVPLILVVLGANLARNTTPDEDVNPEDEKIEKKLLVASLICRMLLPTLIMAPLLALVAKFVPISILDDPIFLIVCFLLTGAPSALQLAQICQINNVYMGAISKLLFQSYVVWILPSTLMLVTLALETVKWATDA